jgi:hypothetical protein
MGTRRLVLPLVAALSFAIAAATATAPRSALFDSHDALPLRLEAPFRELLAKTASENDDSAVTGKLTLTQGGRETTIDGVQISLRGHTSRRTSECTFPKLRVTLPAHDDALDRSVLAGHTVLKIGTHCGESVGDAITAKYGRLANENSPLREAFVYRLLEAMDVPTLKARVARITYVYTDGPASGFARTIVRNAMIVEDDSEAVKRLDGRRQFDERSFGSAHERFAPADTARIAFGEALIGNFDWCLKMTPTDAYRCNARHPLWNVLAIVGADNRVRPLIYDFDVTGMVAGRHRWFNEVYYDGFVPSRSQPAIEVLGQVQRTRSLFNRVDLDATRQHFMQKMPDAYRVLETSILDAAGKERIREYMDAFFAAIGTDEAFYRPAVVVDGQYAYADASQSAPICRAMGPMTVGTVVSDPIETTNRMMRVALLDTRWQWATPKPCPPFHRGLVWIARDAVSRDYPSTERFSVR